MHKNTFIDIYSQYNTVHKYVHTYAQNIINGELRETFKELHKIFVKQIRRLYA